MPIYEYRCDNGHHFDVMQKMTDGPVTECEVAEPRSNGYFDPVAVHFKGSGFYNTDYGTAKRNRQTAASAESGAEQERRQAGREEVRQLVDLELVVLGLVVFLLVDVLDAQQVRRISVPDPG